MESFVETKLKSLLSELNKLFDTNELAYLSSHTKNESPIRDKIAWRLHEDLGKEYKDNNLYVVRREWAPKSGDRRRVDLAVLKMDATLTKVEKAIALIEFKAQSIARPEKWYIPEFKKDVQKMRDFKSTEDDVCKDAELYFVFLETGQSEKAKKYKSVLAYSQYQTGKIVYGGGKDYLSAVKEHWKVFADALGEHVDIPGPVAIEIGEAFGYKQYVSPLLIGPIK